MASLLLAGCGSSSAPVAAPGISLSGNWNIVGSGQFSLPLAPALSLSLVVVGNQIYANGEMGVVCNGNSIGGGGSVHLMGNVASNGAFTLTQPNGSGSTIGGNFITVVVNGTVPPSGLSPLIGTYSMTTGTVSTGCIVNEAGPFTAAVIPPLTGTYAGSFSSSTGSSATAVSMVVSEGAPQSANPIVGNVNYDLPLVGTITVTGNSCFTHGSIDPMSLSQIEGDEVSMIFIMNDGSTLALNGHLMGANVAMMRSTTLSVLTPSQCQGGYIGTLTKQ